MPDMLRLDHAQRRRDRDRRVDGVAAAPQRRDPGPGRQRVPGAHHPARPITTGR